MTPSPPRRARDQGPGRRVHGRLRRRGPRAALCHRHPARRPRLRSRPTASRSPCTSASTPATPWRKRTTTSATPSSWPAGWPTRRRRRDPRLVALRAAGPGLGRVHLRRPPRDAASRGWRGRSSRRHSTGPTEPVDDGRHAGGTPGSTTPMSPTADERLALLEYLTERGATIEQMVEAHRRERSRRGRRPRDPGKTEMVPVDEVAARSGISLRPCPAGPAGRRHPGRARHRGARRPRRAPGCVRAGSALMGDEAILAFTRVLGAAANKIAEAAVALFFAELGPGTGARGPTSWPGRSWPRRRRSPSPRCPTSWRVMVLDAFERAQRRAEAARAWLGFQPCPPPATTEGPTEVVALGFVDLVGRPPGRSRSPARPEPGPHPLRVGRLVERRARPADGSSR